ncbi:HXXXD-type acyl-transferase family protein [Striga asiatica]|uniref:HXXXD-type acyl-transferase family protein n=1 Tax=Striga asiatica TaxID=4170 RepID=A0A5A7R2Q2_STRAF|nr:HXXXD-type acyl-transferase family protein [Striga asiatica]
MAQSSPVVVEIISTETVKPSSPTPQHLRTHKLSYLDQLSTSLYISIIFFYNPNDDHHHLHRTSRRLSESLSHALTSFYPFAGRLLKHSSTVDCNDAGAELSVARVTGLPLADAARDPHDSARYLPACPTEDVSSYPLLLAQLNFFPCGGLAVAVRFAHIADCTSRDRAPPDVGGRRLSAGARLRPDKLAALGRRATGGHTRVELVSAFIWESFIEACNGGKELAAAIHTVSLRKRKKGLENVFGNCLMMSFAYSEKGREFRELAGKLRESIRKVDEGYIAGSEKDGEVYLGDVLGYFEKYVKGEMEGFLFTSWCGFPIYEVDFGWGRPVRICTADLPVNNFAVLIDINNGLEDGRGKGIEAWVNMAEDGIRILEKNFELISDDFGHSHICPPPRFGNPPRPPPPAAAASLNDITKNSTQESHRWHDDVEIIDSPELIYIVRSVENGRIWTEEASNMKKMYLAENWERPPELGDEHEPQESKIAGDEYLAAVHRATHSDMATDRQWFGSRLAEWCDLQRSCKGLSKTEKESNPRGEVRIADERCEKKSVPFEFLGFFDEEPAFSLKFLRFLDEKPAFSFEFLGFFLLGTHALI